MRKNRKQPAISTWGLLLIPALIVAVYGGSVTAPFVYDDRIHIVENPDVNSFRTLFDVSAMHRLLSHPFGLAARPLLFFTYGLNYAAFGLSPTAYRLTNYAIHTANSFLVFLIVLELGRAALWQNERAFRAGLLAGALFAVHPLLTESVTYIAGRSSSLCATFYFAGLYGVLLSGRAASLNRILLLIFALGCAGAALLVKQDAVTLPIAAVALIWVTWPSVKGSPTRWVATAVVLTVSAVLILILQIQPLKTVVTVTQRNAVLTAAGFDETPEFWAYLWTSIREWTAYYLWRLFVPLKLNVDPQIALAASPSAGVLVSLAFPLGLAAGILWLRKRHPMWAVGLALILISPLAAYCLFPLPDLVAEHRAYIAALGAVTVLTALITRTPRPLLVSCVLIFAFGCLTIARNRMWNDEVLLWQDAASKAPDKLRPRFNLAGLYRARGQFERAIGEYEWILRRSPEHWAGINNLASIYMDGNNLSRAEQLLVPAVDRRTPFAPAYQTLAIVRMRQMRFSEAQALLHHAAELDPAQPMIHHNLGDIFVNEGQLDRAINEYTAELRSNPNSLITHLNLAKACEMAGLREKSIEQYQIVQRAEPDNTDVRDALIRLR